MSAVVETSRPRCDTAEYSSTTLSRGYSLERRDCAATQSSAYRPTPYARSIRWLSDVLLTRRRRRRRRVRLRLYILTPADLCTPVHRDAARPRVQLARLRIVRITCRRKITRSDFTVRARVFVILRSTKPGSYIPPPDGDTRGKQHVLPWKAAKLSGRLFLSLSLPRVSPSRCLFIDDARRIPLSLSHVYVICVCYIYEANRLYVVSRWKPRRKA